MKIGFIGQGWIGKNYADDFESRGYDIVRYDIDKYKDNIEEIKLCTYVFVAVPTPTTNNGDFDYSILIDALNVVRHGTVVIIKSTILPYVVDDLEKIYPNLYIIHSPEFLTEATAKYDASNPHRNIVGITDKSWIYGQNVMNILPKAPYELITDVKTACLIKYGGNCWFYYKVLFMNTLYDLSEKNGLYFDTIMKAMAADNRIGETHLNPIHQGGRGAGGNCFIKDFAAYRKYYSDIIGDTEAIEMMMKAEEYNKKLLLNTGKSVELVKKVYNL